MIKLLGNLIFSFALFCLISPSIAHAEVILINGIRPEQSPICNSKDIFKSELHYDSRLKDVRNTAITQSLRMFAKTDAFFYLESHKQGQEKSIEIKSFRRYKILDSLLSTNNKCLQEVISRWLILEQMNNENLNYKGIFGIFPGPYDTISYFIQMVNDFCFTEDRPWLKFTINQELKNKPEIQQYFLDKLNLKGLH